jgi:hypothetical protein
MRLEREQKNTLLIIGIMVAMLAAFKLTMYPGMWWSAILAPVFVPLLIIFVIVMLLFPWDKK